MNLAIVLVHNKGDQGNFDQIETLKPLINKITEQNVDDEGNSFETYHYELQGISQPHELRLYQIIPFGVKEPSNFNDIDSYNVIYRKGDEDKTGDHPRFFNWGLKRATDYGADVVIHVDDPTTFSVKDINSQLPQLADKQNTTEFAEIPTGKMSTLKLLTEVGQLDEAKLISEAVDDLKVSIVDAGLEVATVSIDSIKEVKNG